MDVGLLRIIPVSIQAYESAQGTRDAQLKISELDGQLRRSDRRYPRRPRSATERVMPQSEHRKKPLCSGR